MWIAFRIAAVALLVAGVRLWWPAVKSLPGAIAERRWGVSLGGALLGMMALLLLVQALPLGWRHENPPVVSQPVWDSQRTQDLFARACADCHSNDTRWPWYTNIAPGSWLVANDVYGGRDHLNVSEWVTANARNPRRAREAGEVVRDGSMPPLQFLLIHPDARLTDAEKADLAAGLEASLSQ